MVEHTLYLIITPHLFKQGSVLEAIMSLPEITLEGKELVGMNPSFIDYYADDYLRALNAWASVDHILGHEKAPIAEGGFDHVAMMLGNHPFVEGCPNFFLGFLTAAAQASEWRAIEPRRSFERAINSMAETDYVHIVSLQSTSCPRRDRVFLMPTAKTVMYFFERRQRLSNVFF